MNERRGKGTERSTENKMEGSEVGNGENGYKKVGRKSGDRRDSYVSCI